MKGKILAGLISIGSILYDSNSSKYSYDAIPEKPIEYIILSHAFGIRAGEIERKTGIPFDKNTIDVRIADISYRNINPAGIYQPETEIILLSSSIEQDLNINLKKPIRLSNPKEIANEKSIHYTMDHELGHRIADIVSRRNGLGPWFTKEHYDSLNDSEAIGLNIISEGVGRWFQYKMNPPEGLYDENLFPKNSEELRFYVYDMIVYEGGYFIVKDVLDTYGEKGLVWLIKNPLSIDENNMRKSAVEYREKALLELGKN